MSVLIITGMHRSATSLVASLFDRAGVHLGERLLAADERNRRGFFEDVDFYEFHDHALQARGQTMFVTREFTFLPTPIESERAAQLIAVRAAHSLWGWKDPRTCLFLDFWREHLPDARFVFVYRHPLDVLLSLMRRQDSHMTDLWDGLEAWYVYNQRIAEFRAQHPAQCLLCHSYAVLEQIDAFRACLRERIGLTLSLDAAVRDALYQPSELKRAVISPDIETVLTRAHPEAMELYACLDEAAELPSATALNSAPTASPIVQSFAAWSAAQGELSLPARRGMLLTLIGLTEPDLVETFQRRQARHIIGQQQKLEWVTRASTDWEKLATERERVLQEQQAWVQGRMTYLEKLDTSWGVRMLKRLGLIAK